MSDINETEELMTSTIGGTTRSVRELPVRAVSVRPQFRDIADGVDFVPTRVGRDDPAAAQRALERDGAVILVDWPVGPESVVHAAAAILGTRLRELERLGEATTENTASDEDANSSLLHRDGAYGLVAVNGQLAQLRMPNPDYVLIFGAVRAPAGGESVVVDGYRLVEQIKSSLPELYEFMTRVDIDFTSWSSGHSFQRAPLLHRVVEWTRGGRMIVRSAERAQPAPGDSRRDEHDWLIRAWTDVCETVCAQLRETTVLDPGDALVVDNYRCLHGVRAHEGRRTTYILRCRSQDA